MKGEGAGGEGLACLQGSFYGGWEPAWRGGLERVSRRGCIVIADMYAVGLGLMGEIDGIWCSVVMSSWHGTSMKIHDQALS